MYKKIIKWTILVWMILSVILLAVGYSQGWKDIVINRPLDKGVVIEAMQNDVKADVEKFVRHYNNIYKDELKGADSLKVIALNEDLTKELTAQSMNIVNQILDAELDDEAAKAVTLDTTGLILLQQEKLAAVLNVDRDSLINLEENEAELVKKHNEGLKKNKQIKELDLPVRFKADEVNNATIAKTLNNEIHIQLSESRWGEPFVIDFVEIILIWAYVMFAVGILAMVVVSFIVNTANNPKSLLNLLIMLVVAAGVIALSYFTASGAPAMGITTEQPSGSVLKLTDTILNLTYIMSVATIGAMLFGWIYNLIRK